MRAVQLFIWLCQHIHSIIQFSCFILSKRSSYLPSFLVFQVSSLVQVAGITLCLNAAAKISHRAQGISSLASRWHAAVTCSSADASQIRVSSSMGNLGVASRPNTMGSVFINNSESDLESLEHITMLRNTHSGSYLSSYCKRQAFGM